MGCFCAVTPASMLSSSHLSSKLPPALFWLLASSGLHFLFSSSFLEFSYSLTLQPRPTRTRLEQTGVSSLAPVLHLTALLLFWIILKMFKYKIKGMFERDLECSQVWNAPLPTPHPPPTHKHTSSVLFLSFFQKPCVSAMPAPQQPACVTAPATLTELHAPVRLRFLLLVRARYFCLTSLSLPLWLVVWHCVSVCSAHQLPLECSFHSTQPVCKLSFTAKVRCVFHV